MLDSCVYVRGNVIAFTSSVKKIMDKPYGEGTPIPSSRSCRPVIDFSVSIVNVSTGFKLIPPPRPWSTTAPAPSATLAITAEPSAPKPEPSRTVPAASAIPEVGREGGRYSCYQVPGLDANGLRQPNTRTSCTSSTRHDVGYDDLKKGVSLRYSRVFHVDVKKLLRENIAGIR